MFGIIASGDATTVAQSASEQLINWASANESALNAVLNTIAGLAPSLLPVAVGCIAFRKGIGFLFSVLRGA